MAYFDGLTDGSFKTDNDGCHVYFPWGVMGKGYVLPNEEKKEEIRSFLKRYYQVGLILIIGTQIFVGWRLNLFVFLPILLIVFYVRKRTLLKGIPISTAKLTVSESFAASASSHNLATLWLLEVCSLLFVVGGVLIMVSSGGGILMGLLPIIFFGLTSIAIGRMLVVKMKSRGRAI